MTFPPAVEESMFPPSLPMGEYGWLYYGVCAGAFALTGFIAGYFIWRKGNMQTLDAEMEIQLNESELKNLSADLEREGKQLEPAQTGDPLDALLSNFGEKS